MRTKDTLNLEITGAFKTEVGNIYYAVKNQPGFTYVMHHGNRYYTKNLSKRTSIDDWLHKSDSLFFDVFGNGKGMLERVPFDKKMEVEVFYSSVHHIDER